MIIGAIVILRADGVRSHRTSQSKKARFVSFLPCVWSPAYNRNHFPGTEMAL
jgi:hypothetical protein